MFSRADVPRYHLDSRTPRGETPLRVPKLHPVPLTEDLRRSLQAQCAFGARLRDVFARHVACTSQHPVTLFRHVCRLLVPITAFMELYHNAVCLSSFCLRLRILFKLEVIVIVSYSVRAALSLDLNDPIRHGVEHLIVVRREQNVAFKRGQRVVHRGY